MSRGKEELPPDLMRRKVIFGLLALGGSALTGGLAGFREGERIGESGVKQETILREQSDEQVHALEIKVMQLIDQLGKVQEENATLKHQSKEERQVTADLEEKWRATKREAVKMEQERERLEEENNQLKGALVLAVAGKEAAEEAATGVGRVVTDVVSLPDKVKAGVLTGVVEDVLPTAEKVEETEHDVVNTINETVGEWILPLKEISDPLMEKVMPIAKKLDGAIESIQDFLGKMHRDSLDRVAHILEQINSKLPGRPLTGIVLYFRRAEVKVLADAEPNNVQVLEKLVGQFNRAMDTLDDKLSKPAQEVLEIIRQKMTDPWFALVDEVIKRISDYLLKEAEPLVKEATEIERQREIFKVRQSILKDPSAMAHLLEKAGVDLKNVTPDNVDSAAEKVLQAMNASKGKSTEK